MHELVASIERIRATPMELLQDPSYLEFELLPKLGLNNRHMNQMPMHLHPYCGTGLLSWQYPSQFSQYLAKLSTLKISSYAEIGAHKGGTFVITVEYLSRFNEVSRAVAIDNWPREALHEYAGMHPAVEYLVESSSGPSASKILTSEAFDLVLIDGDHSLEGVRHDLSLSRGSAKYLAFHDIVNVYTPGPQQVWHEVRQEAASSGMPFWEFTDQYDDVLLRERGSLMGIGLVGTSERLP